ncbi:MAG: four helix bundle protein [Candidatus Moranbacteria bacterium]|nr:four helix bundle protein [Candidatus Moranbacteria bacterium]
MENLPIYRKLYILICLLYRYIKQAPKEYKYSLGESLIENAWQCMDYFFEAYYSSGKKRLQKINAMILAFDKMKIRIRMAREIGILKPKSLNHIEALTLTPLGLMMGGWKRKIEKSL